MKLVSEQVTKPVDMEAGFHDLARMSKVLWRVLTEINEGAARTDGKVDEEIDEATMMARMLDEMVSALKSEFIALHFPGDKAPEH